MKKAFYNDLKKIYNITEENQKKLNNFYNILGENPNIEDQNFIDNFLGKIGLEVNNENRMATISRVVSLRDDALIQVLKKANFSENEIIEKKEEAYLWVASHHLKIHQSLINEIEKQELLTPFYRSVFRGVHAVGITFSSWQSSWTAQIIDGTNRELYRLFNGDEEKIFEMLHEKELFDKGHDGNKGDRSYSVLVKQEDGSFKSIPYAEAFASEVTTSLLALADFKHSLIPLEDNLFNQKEEYLNYIQSIIEALAEKDNNKLIPKWADVDRKWMKITTPIQIGHPLEYYEDHYKKAVALEWDMRIVNPDNSAGNIKEEIKSMYKEISNTIENSQQTYENSLPNIEKVQLYLGRPALYYGAEFCGLFSAQVVPNDELITKEEGKKIFAFADNVLESIKAKPFMKIQNEIYPKKFLDQGRELIFRDEKTWHQIYNITTIGHEYGHILWLDHDTESIMNKTGNFKNIEEFKATAGGLVAFFLNEKESLKYHVLNDTIKRAIGLIGWMETGEVEPYYCEALIHLSILFEAEVLNFTNQLEIDMSEDKYNRIKALYIKRYKELATHYINKKDATQFLEKFASKSGKYFLPVDDRVKYFVNYYWNLHQDIGQVVDDSNEKDKWI